jgi:ankyrin repeat protein
MRKGTDPMHQTTSTTPAVKIPEKYRCSITSLVMREPVVTADGHTYEKEAIAAWLEKNNTSPKTGVKLAHKSLIPNWDKKSDIEEFLSENPNVDPEEIYFPASLVKDLIDSLQKNDLNSFKNLLGKDTRLLSKDLKDKKNLLLICCESGSVDILKVALEKISTPVLKFPVVQKDKGLSLFLRVSRRLGLEGARILSKAFYWEAYDLQAVLNTAVKENDLLIAPIALSLGATATFALLHEAYAAQKTESIKILVSAGAPINEKDKAGNDLLMRAIGEDHVELSLFLLTEAKVKEKINLDTRNHSKETALHKAVERNQITVIQTLLDHPRSEINQKDGKGETALHIAVRKNNLDIAKLLIQKKAEINVKMPEGETPLSIAYKANNIEILKLLILSNVEMGQLLLQAIEDERKELVQFLLTEAAQLIDPSIVQTNEASKKSALMLAVEKKQTETVSLLLGHPKINIHQTDSAGNKALHYAALENDQESVKMLMKKGASIKDKNNTQKTPLQLAKETNRQALASWMEGKHRSKKIKPYIKPLQLEIANQQKEMAGQKSEIEHLKKSQKEFKEFKEFIASQEQKTQDKQRRQEQEKIFHAAREREREKARREEESRLKADLKKQEELNLLLKWVTEGHLLEAEKLLSKTPQLSLMKGTVTDLSGREFKNITALQYAFWSLDVEMMEVVLKVLDKGEATSQIRAFEKTPQNYSQYGVHYDVSDLVNKTNEYIQNYSRWDKEQCENHWAKKVGGAQRHCPAWMIYGMCDEGDNAAWCKQDLLGVGKTREYKKQWTHWWFNGDVGGNLLGSNAGCGRGSHDSRCRCLRTTNNPMVLNKDGYVRHDVEVHTKLNKCRLEVVENLKTELASQASMKTGMKQ